RLGGLRSRARAALRAGGGNRRSATLSACALEPVGTGQAGAVFRPGRSRRGARRRGCAHVRRGLGRRILCDGAGGRDRGSEVMQRAHAGFDFFERARARLTLDVPAALTDHAAPATRGDLDLEPEMWERAGVAATRPAAVLVPIVDHPEPTVLLTLRTAALPSHAGQIAFPGGNIAPDDKKT